MKPKLTILLPMLALCLLTGCHDFLDEKPNKQQVVPSTLADLQALLDRPNIINDSDPAAGEVSADNYFLTEADWQGLTEPERRMHTWEPDNLFPGGSNDWSYSYRPVYTANTVLETLPLIERTFANAAQYDQVKGQAHFIRGKSFLQAAIVWSPAYDDGTAASALGVPLRLSSDFETASTRPSLQETYRQLLDDLRTAATLLPTARQHPIRPSKAAAYALLARGYLSMRQYNAVEAYADSSLQLYSTLLDFNELNPNANFPVAQSNREVIYRSMANIPTSLQNSRGRIAPELYASYAENDLRQEVFFRSNGPGTYGFKGSFDGNNALFTGIATGEVLLMRAEARARNGKTEAALQDLNTLLEKRWRVGTFEPLTTDNPEEALHLVLAERRKELLFRGLRWMDLKRYNAEGAGITLQRVIGGQTYTLPPNDLRYALPLPEDLIELTGMPQNPR